MTTDIINNNEEKNSSSSLSDIFAKTSMFARCFIPASLLALAISITVLIMKIGVGLIVFGALIILLGVIAAFNTEKFKTSSSESVDTQPRKITKTSIIILVALLVLGVASIAFGIVMCIGTGENELIYTYDFASTENTFAPGTDKSCTVEVSPEIAGMYTVKIKGAVLDGITTEKGNKIYPTTSDDTDTESYSVFLIINTKYLFSLSSTDAEFSIEFEKTN